ncbi:hypothetical protein [Haloarcula sp. CGMCC 1.2071]|uniref:hypothetical protein n=1 Tax=Haloarcula sp. CGMCC 1.2071 TaxID=3111454 RepID=UPI00300F2A51
MPSDADLFEANMASFKEFVDDDGHHFYVMKFEDDSGRVFKKQPSDDSRSMAEFKLRDQYTKDAMRKIASSTDFEFDESANTQQNLRNLLTDQE